MAAPRDLVTILYKPRETMRRILDEPRRRWTAEIIVLAVICSTFGDRDIRNAGKVLPDLALGSTLALVVVVLAVAAACWVAAVYLVSWLVALAGKFLDGQGTAADVRAALAWAFVPVIWSILYRIPIGLYRSRIKIHGTNSWQVLVDVVQQGGVTLAFVYLALQLVVDIWVVFLASSNVAEALKFETWRGFSAIAIVAAIPIVVAAAAVLTLSS